jgi:predicted transcriptional regulator
MARNRQELTRLEWALMDALWEARQATASDLQKRLEPTQGWAYSTVKTMLDRLLDMGFVKARRVGNVYEYSPKVARPAAVRRIVDEMVDRLFRGDVTPLVQHLVDRADFDDADVAKLKKILDQYRD